MISRVAVVGAGTMGAGIAQLCAQSGFGVKVHDALPAALAALPARLRKSLDAAVLRGKLGTQQADRAYHAISPAAALEDLAGADLVIEAAPEDLALKQDLFEKLSKICPDALLATNTSSLSVTEIMRGVQSPERALGIHFFNPPVAMKLIELVRAEKTGTAAFQVAWEFAASGLRRTPVDVKDVPGFIVNRVLRPYYVLAQRMVSVAAPFGFIDEACRTHGGVPMGPFELMDLIGLDVNFAITTSIYEALGRPERFAPPALQRSLVEMHATGRKAGVGFYAYENGAKTVVNWRAEGLLPPGAPLAPEAAWLRLRNALIAEADLVASAGTASAGDIDTAVKLAMNFPKGPFEWRKENTVAWP